MALDLFASVRSTALITLVAASFTAPVVIKSDALASVKDKLPGGGAQAEQAPPEQLLAGGVQFEMPADWGRVATSNTPDEVERVGTVVSALCPGGTTAGECSDGTQLTFVTYSGEDGHELPALTTLETQFDAQLAKEYPGFAAGDARMKPGADGIRYLDYPFAWKGKGASHHQQIAAYRHEDGSGVVVLGTGQALATHDKAIDEFFASAHEPVADEA